MNKISMIWKGTSDSVEEIKNKLSGHSLAFNDTLTIDGRITAQIKDTIIKTTIEGIDSFEVIRPWKFNEKADAYLDSLYKSVGAITAEQKYNTLFMRLGYHLDGSVINFSHNPTWEQKQGMMEYDLLEREKLIEMIYC